MDWLITCVVIVMVVLMIIAMIKSEHARPYLIFVFCLGWFFLGSYNAFTLNSYLKAHSRTYGEPEIHNPYEDFDYYEYNLDDIAWFIDEEDGSYYYQTTYATSMEFDGTDNEYTLLINNKPCETSSAYGKLQGHQAIYFNDVDGSYKNTIDLDVVFTFYASTINLLVETNADNESVGLLNEYIKVNKFNLRIIDKVYTSFPLLTEVAD